MRGQVLVPIHSRVWGCVIGQDLEISAMSLFGPGQPFRASAVSVSSYHEVAPDFLCGCRCTKRTNQMVGTNFI